MNLDIIALRVFSWSFCTDNTLRIQGHKQKREWNAKRELNPEPWFSFQMSTVSLSDLRATLVFISRVHFHYICTAHSVSVINGIERNLVAALYAAATHLIKVGVPTVIIAANFVFRLRWSAFPTSERSNIITRVFAIIPSNPRGRELMQF